MGSSRVRPFVTESPATLAYPLAGARELPAGRGAPPSLRPPASRGRHFFHPGAPAAGRPARPAARAPVVRRTVTERIAGCITSTGARRPHPGVRPRPAPASSLPRSEVGAFSVQPDAPCLGRHASGPFGVDRRGWLGAPDQEHRTGRLPDHRFGDGSKDQPAKPGASVGRHHDDVGGVIPGESDDGGRDRRREHDGADRAAGETLGLRGPVGELGLRVLLRRAGRRGRPNPGQAVSVTWKNVRPPPFPGPVARPARARPGIRRRSRSTADAAESGHGAPRSRVAPRDRLHPTGSLPPGERPSRTVTRREGTAPGPRRRSRDPAQSAPPGRPGGRASRRPGRRPGRASPPVRRWWPRRPGTRPRARPGWPGRAWPGWRSGAVRSRHRGPRRTKAMADSTRLSSSRRPSSASMIHIG